MEFVEYPAEMLGADVDHVNGRGTAPLERYTGSNAQTASREESESLFKLGEIADRADDDDQ